MLIEEALAPLAAGLRVGDCRLRVGAQRPGSVDGTRVLSLVLEGPRGDQAIAQATCYRGRPPHYHPWVELYGLPERVTAADLRPYPDSPYEAALLDRFAAALPAAGRLYVTYDRDPETLTALNASVPPVATRLGHHLYVRGFTWFKDWYYPEGGQEGTLKLQGEKPLDEAARQRHTSVLRRELGEFLESAADASDDAVRNAQRRARDLLSQPGP